MAESSEIGSPTIPQLDMPSILKDARDFASVKTVIVEAIKKMRTQGITRIGFVSGPIGNASPYVDDETGTAINKSMDEMRKVTEEMVTKHHIPIFSSTDIFRVKWKDLSEVQQIQQGTLIGPEKDGAMNALFGGILEEGGITDIFMMKGWRKAPGAIYEHSVAEKPGSVITIHNLDLQK